MIGYLRGIARTSRIVDVNGVGYVVACPTPLVVGDEVELHVHTQVRDDAINLYGFASDTEKHLFEALVKVTGVGPGTALALIGGLGPANLADAITRRDVKALASVKGVGAKVAEKIVTLCQLPAGTAGDPRVTELANVLVGLGYERRVAQTAAGTAIEEAGGETGEDAETLTRAIAIANRSAA